MDAATAQPFTRPLIDAVEGAGALDAPASALGAGVRGAVGHGAARDALSGRWLGHALHPLLSDVVVGTFMSASLLDLTGQRADSPATRRLIAIGILAALPTSLSGASDWAEAEAEHDDVRRTGVVHAILNVTALGLYTTSLAARRQGRPARAKLLSLAGVSALGVSGFLGGHLAFAQEVGLDDAREHSGRGGRQDAGTPDA